MNQTFTSYLSLGSNLGDKLENLKNAVNAIDINIGKIIQISNIYETPSWGFEGDVFYNLCLKTKTTLQPNELLSNILELEKTLGRKRKDTQEYQNRNIDIDIILYESIKITSQNLIIPHPRTLERKFVLIPLADIYDEDPYPFNNFSLLKNIEQCNDTGAIKKTIHSISKP
ncbi:2-amino-4-hydroxy-6-hydroxymethyldihydropteridine diphosphokinase [Flavicella sp.]|uniref:2-amino-4-hydroxy-6- hydroxymethyldihydropteridine diphosphokinase n=1 Tax=Flavicella sp. TaxID=2957742 RepID=UPI00301B35AE